MMEQNVVNPIAADVWIARVLNYFVEFADRIASNSLQEYFKDK